MRVRVIRKDGKELVGNVSDERNSPKRAIKAIKETEEYENFMNGEEPEHIYCESGRLMFIPGRPRFTLTAGESNLNAYVMKVSDSERRMMLTFKPGHYDDSCSVSPYIGDETTQSEKDASFDETREWLIENFPYIVGKTTVIRRGVKFASETWNESAADGRRYSLRLDRKTEHNKYWVLKDSNSGIELTWTGGQFSTTKAVRSDSQYGDDAIPEDEVMVYASRLAWYATNYLEELL